MAKKNTNKTKRKKRNSRDKKYVRDSKRRSTRRKTKNTKHRGGAGKRKRKSYSSLSSSHSNPEIKRPNIGLQYLASRGTQSDPGPSEDYIDQENKRRSSPVLKTVDQVIRENRKIKGTNIDVFILDSTRGLIKYEGTHPSAPSSAQHYYFNYVLNIGEIEILIKINPSITLPSESISYFSMIMDYLTGINGEEIRKNVYLLVQSKPNVTARERAEFPPSTP